MKLPLAVSHRIARLFIALAIVAGLALAGSTRTAFGQSKSGFTYNGMDYISYQANEYLETPQGPEGAAVLRAAGANYTAVMATWFVQTSNSTTIAPNSNSPTDAAVVAAIQNLQAQGITVTLKPHVDSLDNNWRGQFTWPASDTTTAQQQAWLTAWFTSYEAFILHFAQIAAENNVGILVIGTEFAQLTGNTCAGSCRTYWDQYVINPLRTNYPNLLLVYGANATSAGDEFTKVTFWDDVDIIGVDGYFPLTNHADPTLAELVSAWTNASANKNNFNPEQALQNLQSAHPTKPLIFSELGYMSTAGTNEEPYNYSHAGAYDQTEQANCYEAFFEVFSPESSWMKGVFWWDWSVSAPGANDTGYSPQGKSAGDTVLPEWYGAAAAGFTLAPSVPMMTIGQGLSSTDTISVTPLGGFNGTVTLAATGLPAGVTAVFAAGSTSVTQVLTLTVASGAAIGATTITVTGTSGSITATTTIALNLQAALSQTITFANPGAQVVGTQLTLSAPASSGLPVTFASSTAAVCTLNNPAGPASLLAVGTCNLTASQAGNALYSPAQAVSQSFLVSTLPPVPVPVAADLIASQLNWLAALSGYVQTSNNPTGGSFAVNAYGELAVADTNSLYLINTQTGAAKTLGAWAGASALAIDSKNNIYLGSLYGSPEIIVKIPYTGGASNGGYAAFSAPTNSTPSCTSSSTAECSVSHVGSIYPEAMAFDAAGDLFWITASNGGNGGNSIWECTAACLGGAGSPVELYLEPTATVTPSTASGQLIAGGLAVDSSGNVFFTDSSSYVAVDYKYTSFYSDLKELPISSGAGYGGKTTGYAASPSVLYTLAPSSIGPYNNQLDGLAILRNAALGDTVYFADQSDGVFGFPDTAGGIPIANGQPTALYTVSTQGAKTLTLDSQGNLYLAASTTVIKSSGADTLAQLTLDSLTVPASNVGTQVSPSATLNPVTTLLNDTACSATPAPSVNFVAGASTTATATIGTAGSCSSTFSGGSAFSTTVSFTPAVGGTDSVPFTATDQADNTATVTVTGIGQVPLTAQTITFANPGAQTVGTPLTLSASATSGLAVSFTSATTNVCTVSNGTATFLTPGTCIINANQAGNSAYSPAPQVTQSFAVNAAPSFALAASPGTLTISQGGNGTETITVAVTGGFAGNVTLAATGLPSGVTAAFSPDPTTSGSSTLTLTASNTATLETVTITIKGTSGNLTASTTVRLTVKAAPGFSLSASPNSLTFTQGASGASTISVTDAGGFSGAVTLAASGLPNGVTAAFGVNPATGTSVLTLTASSTATSGQSTITITGTSGALTASATIALAVNALPSFTLSASPSTLPVNQGSSATDTIAVTGVSGFTGSVTLAASGLPSGVTAAFSKNPANSSSVLTLTASKTATAGPATMTITGTSGTLTATTTLALTVVAPSFALTPTASAVTVIQGSNATDTISLTDAGGFTGSVTLAATGLPSGVTAAFATNPATKSSVLTLTASKTAATGVATITMNGTSGSLKASTTIQLTVNVPPSFTLAASPATLSVSQGSSGTSAISVTGVGGFAGGVTLAAAGLPGGVTAAFATNPTTNSSLLTLTASKTATTGAATVTINGTSGSLKASATVKLSVTVPPSFTLSASPSSLSMTQGSSGNSSISVVGAGGFTGNVSLAAAGLPSGVTAAFATNPTAKTSVLTLTASNTATTGAATVAITGTSGTLTATTSVKLTVAVPPSFTLSASPQTLAVNQGSSGTSTISLTGAGGFTGSVKLAATGLPSGVTAAFATNPTAKTSVLTLTASKAATTGAATVTITGTSGSLAASTTVNLTVNVPPSFTLTASPASLSINKGSNGTSSLSVTGAGGFSGSVKLAASGLPSGVTAAFATNPTANTSVLTLTAGKTAATGKATVSITGTSGTLSASVSIQLTVN